MRTDRAELTDMPDLCASFWPTSALGGRVDSTSARSLDLGGLVRPGSDMGFTLDVATSAGITRELVPSTGFTPELSLLAGFTRESVPSADFTLKSAPSTGFELHRSERVTLMEDVTDTCPGVTAGVITGDVAVVVFVTAVVDAPVVAFDTGAVDTFDAGDIVTFNTGAVDTFNTGAVVTFDVNEFDTFNACNVDVFDTGAVDAFGTGAADTTGIVFDTGADDTVVTCLDMVDAAIDTVFVTLDNVELTAVDAMGGDAGTCGGSGGGLVGRAGVLAAAGDIFPACNGVDVACGRLVASWYTGPVDLALCALTAFGAALAPPEDGTMPPAGAAVMKISRCTAPWGRSAEGRGVDVFARWELGALVARKTAGDDCVTVVTATERASGPRACAALNGRGAKLLMLNGGREPGADAGDTDDGDTDDGEGTGTDSGGDETTTALSGLAAGPPSLTRPGPAPTDAPVLPSALLSPPL